jgi:hypothetical protein
MFMADRTAIIATQSSFVLGRILLCVLLASCASLIASVFTKLISTHFYRSTHFKKLHEALGKEFQLKVRHPSPADMSHFIQFLLRHGYYLSSITSCCLQTDAWLSLFSVVYKAPLLRHLISERDKWFFTEHVPYR